MNIADHQIDGSAMPVTLQRRVAVVIRMINTVVEVIDNPSTGVLIKDAHQAMIHCLIAIVVKTVDQQTE